MNQTVSRLLVGFLGISVIALDQISKWLVITRAHQSEYTLNKGICFGLGTRLASNFTVLYWALTLVIFTVISMIIWQAVRALSKHRAIWPYALMVSGALSNIIDRVMHGGVIDFIALQLSLPVYGMFHWPLFNIADLAIIGGICGLIFYELLCTAQASQ